MNEIISEIKKLELETLENIKSSKSYNTTRAYKSDFKNFIIFCSKINKDPINPSIKDISLYLTYLSKQNLKFSTIKRNLVSIVMANRMKGFHIDTKNPLISENIKSIKRKIGTQQIGKKPITLEILKKIINSIYLNNKISKNKKIRDKALILIGFSGGFRRSELINLDLQDIEFVNEGIKIEIKKSKTDQYGQGFIKAIPYFTNNNYCPVLAIKKWIEISLIDKNSIFRKISKSGNIINKRLTDQSVALILKQHMLNANLNPQNYSGHSLRSGFATSTAYSGANERSIMLMTGHKSINMVRRYIKEANLFKNNALNKLEI